MSPWKHRRGSRGMTLIEILVVIVIIALLVVAMVLYLRPRDDRLVELEAERLAKYLTGASAEAMMRDGPVRVSLDLETGVYDREIGRVGVAVMTAQWEDDPSEDLDKVKKPVRLTMVLRPGLGQITTGTTWLLWDGRRTEGGVAILSLNEAVWSVVVEPVNGRIHVQRGRVELPDPTGAFVRRNLLPPPPDGPPLGDSEGLGFDPTGGPGPADPEPEPPDPPHDAGRPPDAQPPHDGGSPDSQPPPDAGGLDQFPMPDLGQPDAEPDATPDAGAECHPETHPCEGTWESCLSQQTENGTQFRCVRDPRGHAFRARFLTIIQPAEVAGLVGLLLNSMVNSGELNLIVWFPSYADPPTGPSSPFRGWTIEGFPAGAGASLPRYGPHPQLPSYGSLIQPRTCDGQDEIFCAEVIPFNAAGEGRVDKLDLFVPTFTGTPRECHTRITVVAHLMLTVVEGDPPQASLQLNGMISEVDARKMKITTGGGQPQTLKQLLEAADAEMNADTNADNRNDGWNFVFEAQTQEIDFVGDPSGRDFAQPGRVCGE